MPRIPSTSCTKALSKRCLLLRRFIPCFFDVPHKHVLEIVGVSHHTIDPIRRSLQLDGWPYNDVVRGKFCMSRARIVAMRGQAMAVAGEDMQRILTLIAAKAAECWAGMPEGTRILAERCRETKRAEEFQCLLESSQMSQEEEPTMKGICEKHVAVPAPSWEEAVRTLDDDPSFWEEISQLLQLQEVYSDQPREPSCPVTPAAG